MVFLATLRQYSWANQKPALGNSLDLGIRGIRGSGENHMGYWTVFLLFCNMLKHIHIYTYIHIELGNTGDIILIASYISIYLRICHNNIFWDMPLI